MAAERLRAKFLQDPNLFPTSLPSPTDPRFGDLGYAVGTTFESRAQVSSHGLHGPTFAGISGTANLGAFSVVVSGGYADDRDEGDFIEYTGTGGQADSFGGTNIQVTDQSFSHSDNRALQKSAETQRPIRVIRGPRANSKYAPEAGYRFDGMYIVTKAFLAQGIHGLAVCKFHLHRVSGQAPLITRF